MIFKNCKKIFRPDIAGFLNSLQNTFKKSEDRLDMEQFRYQSI